MAQALAKPQETESPWAYVAFEAEIPQPDWEPFELVQLHQGSFLSLEKSSSAGGPERSLPGSSDFRAAPPEEEAPDRARHEYLSDAIPRYERRLQELEESHQASLEQIEQKYAVELAQRMTAQVEAISSELGQETGKQLTRMLAPLLADHARKASMEALTRDLQRILLSTDITLLRISGPQALLKQVQDALGESASRLECVETDSVDVTVEIDSGILATKLSNWAATLKEVVA
jgi:23S rRNA pseudoU1915 N3-methylase RlmH